MFDPHTDVVSYSINIPDVYLMEFLLMFTNEYELAAQGRKKFN